MEEEDKNEGQEQSGKKEEKGREREVEGRGYN